MTILLLSVVIVALCVFGLCFNIIFRKKDFPQFDIGSNEEMQKRGIRCFKDVDAAIHSKGKCNGTFTEACRDCALYGTHNTEKAN